MRNSAFTSFYFLGVITVIGILSGCSGGSSSSGSSGLAPTVQTSIGEIQGLERSYSPPVASGASVSGSGTYTVYEYRGIPYAQALTQDDRWGLAKPATTLGPGVFKAYEHGAACPQQARFDLTEASFNEDCLTLNIVTPVRGANSGRLPVVIWIPGGGFVGGSSNLYRLDKLAFEGQIIVVSMNYRVGALGFMPHPSITEGWNGNLGLEDQRLAMQWIKDNIGSFGGDKTKITLGGESAGAASTCLHVLSKTKTDGLFQQAAPLSYNCLYEWPTLASALTESNIAFSGGRTPIYQRMADELGCSAYTGSAQLSCMRKKSIPEILLAQGKVNEVVPLFPYAPVIKSGVNGTMPLADYSAASVKANIQTIPMLYGGAKDELRLYVAYDTIAEPTVKTSNLPIPFRDFELLRYYSLDSYPPADGWPAKFANIINEYFGAGPISADALGSMVSDYTPVVGLNHCSYLRTAKAFSEIMPLYQWEFADPNALVLGVGIAKGQDPRMSLGPVHSAALNYLFPNLSNTSAINAPDLPGPSQLLANQMVQMWTQFVKTGAPHTPNLSNWPKFNEAALNLNVMQFIPDNVKLINAASNHKCSFWEAMDSKLNPISLR
jgi:para-nitrobenzyl esterase